MSMAGDSGTFHSLPCRLLEVMPLPCVQGMCSPAPNKKRAKRLFFYLVPLTGIEPVRCFHRGILSPLRLPVPPQRQKNRSKPLPSYNTPPEKSSIGLDTPPSRQYNITVIKTAKKAVTGSVLPPSPSERKPFGCRAFAERQISRPRAPA